MVDERLLDSVREFWSLDQCLTTWQSIFEAELARLNSVTIIVGKNSESEGAQAQVVVMKEDYREWQAVLKFRVTELREQTAGLNPIAGPEHVNFGRRYSRT